VTKRWPLVVATVVLLAAGALTAVLVTGDDASTVGLDRIQLAAANTEGAESMQFELQASGPLGVSARGVVSGDGEQGQVTVELGRFGRIEERVVDGTVYVKAAGLLGGSDDEWYSVSVDRLRDLAGSFGGDAASAFDGSPADALDVLDELAGPVETIGDDTVGGRHATHYRVHVDAKGTRSPVDVWIDDQDRVVKLVASVPDGGDLTFEVTSFGVPVDVQAPPADQVEELPDLSSLIGRAGRADHAGTGVI
jgi:hypothetical protein